ncbi:quinolinate synthase NadA [Corynebacterium heidelbergense]|uniref:Quinolinate synthase n=1 Tax=Corynebacterium heidelbergense TaxID=2055947 RepID=A0A364V3E2_9CORY|nr:quinolinate synthase [Corynebacterium heidelbergense]
MSNRSTASPTTAAPTTASATTVTADRPWEQWSKERWSDWTHEVRRLAEENNAIILAHNYQLPQIQDIAHHVGDSLALSRIAADTDADTVVFCGVHFMAETAKLLSPGKRVLIPDANAGCSLADSITAEDLRAWKAEHPRAVVVSYVNTTAEVKAETDICCTSSNAVDVVNSIPADREVLFCPDQFLGAHVQRETGRENLHIWMGECHVHADISPTSLEQRVREAPHAELYVHPECGCTTSALWMASSGEFDAERTHVMSTGQMLDAARGETNSTVLVATEVGMLHQLRQANPNTEFTAVNPEAACPFMQMITPPKLLECLRNGTDEVEVPADIAERARGSVERMIAIGQPGGGE